jgi:hypothetical protein
MVSRKRLDFGHTRTREFGGWGAAGRRETEKPLAAALFGLLVRRRDAPNSLCDSMWLLELLDRADRAENMRRPLAY